MTAIPLDVEVVVITHRSASELPACLASIGAPERTVVIDNASGDAGPDLARTAGCRVVETGANLGFARAVDRAMQLTSAPYVLFLNPDATLEADTAEQLRAAMIAEDIAVAAARLRRPDGTWQRAAWPFPGARRSWSEAFGFHLLRAAQAPADSVVGACMLVRRAAFEQVGGFDERFWLYGEETDFCRRGAEHGWRSIVVPGAVCTHIGGASAARSPVARAQFIYGTDRFVLHHHGRAALVSHRLALLVGSAVRWPLLCLGPGRAQQRRTRAFAIRSCIRSLVTNPTTVPTVPHEATRTVVVCSLERWDDVWRRNQFFVRELVSDLDRPTRMLFVEPPVDVLHELRSRRRSATRPDRIARPAEGMPGVMLLRPRKVLPRLLGGWADRSLQRQVLRGARDVGFDDPVLWINDAALSGLLRRTQWPSLYDITDDWLHERVPRREHRRRVRRERVLLEHADRVVVCSEALAVDRRTTRPVAVVTNGVDVEAFRVPQPRPTDLPSGPTAVYIGTLHRERVDLELVAACADRLPDVQFVFVGPNCLEPDETAQIDRCTNVHLLGSRPHACVPGYLQHADVCIVPHVVTPFTESLDPIKAYECRAVGVPTLATPVAGFRGLGGVIRTCDAGSFPDQLAELFDNLPSSAADSEVPTWRERAVEFGRELDAARAPRRRSVVFVGHTAKPGGGELALARLVPGFRAVDCHVVLGEDGPLVSRLRAAGATVEVLAMSTRSRGVQRSSVTWRRLPVASVFDSFGYSIRLARRLRQLRPDLVHTNTLKAALYGGLAGRLARIPVVWHIRDRIAEDYLPAGAVRTIRLLARFVPAAVITNSAATLDTIGAGSRRSTVPSPVNDPVLAHRGPSCDGGERPFRVVMVGRLAPWKGQHIFLRAFAAADLPQGTEGVIVGSALFGEDDYVADLHHLRDHLGLADRVRFTGQVDDVAALLAEADVLVHCSTIPEPFGQVVVEGLAAGLAVIASDAGGPSEVITHGLEGLLVPPGDIDGLAAAMADLAADPVRRERLGAAGQRRVVDMSPDRVGRIVEAVYDEVLSARRAGR